MGVLCLNAICGGGVEMRSNVQPVKTKRNAPIVGRKLNPLKVVCLNLIDFQPDLL